MTDLQNQHNLGCAIITHPDQLKDLETGDLFNMISQLQTQLAISISDCTKATQVAAEAENERMYETANYWVLRNAFIARVGSAEKADKIIEDLRPTAEELFSSWSKDVTSRPSTTLPNQ